MATLCVLEVEVGRTTISTLMVIGFLGVAELLLRVNSALQPPGHKYWEVFGSILAGSVPIALLGAEVIEREALATIFGLVGFGYFCLMRKQNAQPHNQ